jgi:sortase A
LRFRCAQLLLLSALAVLIDALWIPTKAGLAQWLLQRSWTQALASGDAKPPWGWADAHAVARLVRLSDGRSQIVLAGDNGRALAFGPGWNQASAQPGEAGTVVISAHRDTHFAWLRDIDADERLQLETLLGSRRYRLRGREVIDVRTQSLAPSVDHDQLLLVTCWPFDAAEAGGPLRLLLRFEPEPAFSGDPSALAQR